MTGVGTEQRLCRLQGTAAGGSLTSEAERWRGDAKGLSSKPLFRVSASPVTRGYRPLQVGWIMAMTLALPQTSMCLSVCLGVRLPLLRSYAHFLGRLVTLYPNL